MALPAMNEFAKLFGRGIKFPSPHEARWITDSVRHTPDLAWLEQHDYQLLFCPDETKEGQSHHCLIDDSEFLATAYSANRFNYWYQKAGDDILPIPMQVYEPAPEHVIRFFPPALKIKGQLRLVRSSPADMFVALDNHKRNTVQFRRKRVNVFVPYRELRYQQNAIAEGDSAALFRPRELPKVLQGTRHAILSDERMEIIRCWMYVGMPSFWDNLLDAGYRGFKTVSYYESKRPWLKEYYDFSAQVLK